MNNKTKFVAVDLHVHTPASAQCYNKGNCTGSDEEYIELLKVYRDNDIKVMAITDHNTIKGYKRLLDIRSRLEERVKSWAELSEIPDVREKLKLELDKLSLFRDILILPGIEFEAFPGIHLLLIFNVDIDTNILDKFLEDSGYDDEKQGKEQCKISKLSVLEVLEWCKKLGGITVAAHVDRDKGIYNDLKKGAGRVEVFKSDSLMGMQVNTLPTISEIEALLRNKEYKRDKPLAFIRCSDYHKDKTNIESYITYMKLEEFDFESINNAFLNPIECISFTRNPESTEIIKKLIDEPTTLFFKNASDENIPSISAACCAILNNRNGTVIIGINDDKSIIGIRKSIEECEEIVSNVLSKVNGSEYLINYNTSTYKYGNGNVLVLNLQSSGNSIYSINNEVYILKNNKVVLASPYDLIKIGEEGIISKIKKIQLINNDRIENIYSELEVIRQLDKNLSLYSKINSSSLKLMEIVDIRFKGVSIDRNIDNIIEGLVFGKSTGSTFFLEKVQVPHERNVYTRCTCPRTDEDIDGVDEEKIFNGDCAVIVLGGACHYIECIEAYKILNSIPILILTINDKYKENYCIQSIVGWLKSPILFWYLDFMFNETDLLDPKILKDIPVPMVESMKPNREIGNIVKNMEGLEKLFLDRFNEFKIDKEIIDESELDDKVVELINNHNHEISNCATNIEKQLIKDLGISSTETEVIQLFLKKESIQEIVNYDSNN